MKALYGMFAAAGAIGIMLYLFLVLGIIGLSLYGLILGFKASILLGILILFVEPLPLAFGLCKVFAGIDIAQRIVEFFSN